MEKIIPKHNKKFTFEFKGLVAFYDPPKKKTSILYYVMHKAGIKVKIAY
jgi:Ca2+-transporting ATPase